MEYMRFTGINAEGVAQFVTSRGYLARVTPASTSEDGVFSPQSLHVRETEESQEFWVWPNQFVVIDEGITISGTQPTE